MIDVKKLITGFLVLVVAAVCSGFLILSITGRPTTAQNSSGASAFGIGSSNISNGNANAFVDTGSLQGNAAEILSETDSSSTDAQASDPDNLTNVFADSFISGLETANPNGITADQSGADEINAPDTQAVADNIASNAALQNLVVPNWDVEAQSQLVKTTPSSSPQDIAQYSNSLNSVLNEYFVSDNLQSEMESQTADSSDFPYISSEIQSALNDTLAIRTPAPLVSLQESLIRVMIYEKNSVQLAENAEGDPVRTSLVMQDEQSKYSSALANLQQQMQKASSLGLSFGNSSPEASVPFIARLFGVQPAHAIFGVGDITFDPTAFGQLLIEELNKTILQILKNTLTTLLQKKVLTAIQGSGAPKFVTSFAAEMVNSFQSAALKTINTQIGQAPANQQATLKLLTQTQYQAPNASSSLGTKGPNTGITASSSFTNFNDYLSEFNSGGNVWANALAINDNAVTAGSNNQTAKTTQNTAQQGFTGSQVCDDGSNPNGTGMMCDDGIQPYAGTSNCPDGVPPITFPNGGLCTDGTQPKITTPGQITGQMSNTAVKSGQENITSADGIAGLLDALTTSLLNSLAQSAINDATKAINGALSSNSGSGLLGISPTSTPTSTASSTQPGVLCYPSIQPLTLSRSIWTVNANISAGGGALDMTCASGGNCPSTENSDGSPIYSWSAPGSTQSWSGTPLNGSSILLSYSTPGTYYATVTASTDNSTSTCEIDITMSTSTN